jgi:putative ABC transport system permease protein
MRLDLLVAARMLARRPGYAVSVILTLAIGIGASTLMFALLDVATLRSLPFKDPDGLVALLGVSGPQRDVRGGSFPEIHDWARMTRTLDDVAIYDETSLNLRVGDEALRVEAEMVSPAYFRLLGVTAALGRTFLPAEDRTPDAKPVVVISDRLWRGRLGGDPAVLQRHVFLNDRQFAIVGVMPHGFSGISFDSDIWFPSMMVSLTSTAATVQNRGNRWLTALGRLKPDTSLEQAQQDLTRVAAILEQEHPDFQRERGVQVTGLQAWMLGATGPLLSALFGSVLLFLLIACANVASLQLARTISRGRELAVRIALGASQWHAIRSVLAETVLLSSIAGAAGALLAAWGLAGVAALMPTDSLPTYVRLTLDVRALLFAAAASVLSGALVAILPAVKSRQRDVNSAIKDGARTIEGGIGTLRRPAPQQLLVIGQIALAMTLLAGAALLVRSLERQLAVDLGFDPRGVTVARLTLPATAYPPAERSLFVDRLVQALRAAPQVAEASVSSDLPLTGTAAASILTTDASDDRRIRYYRHFVAPGYFQTLGVALIHGRDFARTDAAQAPLVAMINSAGARRLWGSPEAAVGRRIHMGPGITVEIIGVVADARYRDLTTNITAGTAEPDVFFPFAQRTDRDIEIAVRSSAGAPITIGALQQVVSTLDSGLPVYAVQPLTGAVAQQTATARFFSVLLSSFSLGALLLSALGLYGLISYVVGSSRRDIAVRLALGAATGRVLLLIVRNGMALVGIGVIAGLVGGIAAGRLVEAQLFQTASSDPVVLGSVASLLLVITCLATAIPARRASRIDPHTVLRGE